MLQKGQEPPLGSAERRLFDAHYGVYGTYFALSDTNDALGTAFIDPRTIVPAAPITAYGGLKVKF
jgi:hypothetical protein